MQDLELSVTICSWNTREDLRACLQSLRQVAHEARFEVIVIENASSDGSAEMVETEFPQFILLKQTENLGFTGGHNIGFAHAKARDVMLLNSDTIVHAGALRTLLDFVHEHPEVGIVGPKLLNPDGSLQLSCRRFPNPIAALFRNTFIGRWFPKNRFTREYLMQDWGHDEPRDVDWLSGAAMIVTRQVIEQVGVLDPKFFMYCEDVDLCFRTWKHGMKVVYVPGAVITHAIGRSTDRIANKMIVRFHRSMFRFYMKNQVPEAFILWRPFMLGFALLALTTRAGLFLIKNWKDAVVRKLKH